MAQRGQDRDWRRLATDASLRGCLLVATPLLSDPNFDRTVILVLEHKPEGAVGVVLNRPSTADFVETLPDWYGLAASPPVVFVGGPVGESAVIGLARVRDARTTDGFTEVAGHIGTVDLTLDPVGLEAGVEEIRVFSGYAGWGEGQIEGEIDAGAWWVVDAEPDDAMSGRPESLWHAALRRQHDNLALHANFPDDPSLN